MSLWHFIVKKRVFFGFVFAVCFLVFSTPTVTTVLAGIPLGALGLSLRAWSSGLIRKNKSLATDGPYSMTRNPLYVGSFLAGCGGAVMGGNLWLALTFIVFYLAVYRQIILNEEAHLITLFPSDLPTYMASVPRFMPNVFRFSGFGEYDSSLMWKKHKEWQAWLGFAVIAGILLTKALGYWSFSN